MPAALTTSAAPTAEEPAEPAAHGGRHPARSAWWRFGLLVVLLGACAGSLLLWSPTDLLSGGLAHRMPGYWFAPLFTLVYAVGTLAFVPRPALNAAAGLLLGKCALPYDPAPVAEASGIRLGTGTVTTQGMGVPELTEIAALIARLLSGEAPGPVGERVRELAAAFARRG